MNKVYLALGLILFLSILPQSLRAAPEQKMDTSLLMPATTLMQKIKQGKKLFLVDIRHKTEFNQFKIPGSLNIPMAFIQTKSFLKSGPIVLVHQGVAHGDLIHQAEGLRGNGFDVYVLQGGLAAWQHKGGDIVGDPFAAKNLNIISAKQFFMGKDQEDWIIINACSPPDKRAKTLIPQARDLAIGKPEGKTPHLLNTLLETNPSPTAAMIVFTQSDLKFKNQIHKRYRDRVFFLKGGLDAYAEFLSRQLLANRPKAQRIREIGHCEPCKENTPQ